MLQAALSWLRTRPAEDPRHDFGLLMQYLKEVAGTAVPPLQRLAMLDLFQIRVDHANRVLKPQLLGASVPLSPHLRSIAQSLTDLHGLLAATMLHSLRELAPAHLANPRGDLPALCRKVLGNLAQQQQITLFVAATTPNGLWTSAQEAYRLAGAIDGADRAAVERELKGMLALTAVQPESFTARELAYVSSYLQRFSTAVEIQGRPASPLDHWYWLEESRDLPPVAIARRAPPGQGRLLFFSCVPLATLASEHLTQLADGTSSEQFGLGASGDNDFDREVLVRAQKYWATPPRRRLHRRSSHYRVEVCTRLEKLWELLRQSPSPVAGNASPVTSWLVLNESPSGMALMHAAGPVADIVPGEMLGLRTTPDRPWSIGLIRWVRSDNPEHVELGLEMISPSATAVQLVLDASGVAKFVPALLFATVSGPECSETLMIERGLATAAPFTLIKESAGKLQLTECRMLHPTLQTAKVELFEFQRDFSP
jgi:hypothetical protein